MRARTFSNLTGPVSIAAAIALAVGGCKPRQAAFVPPPPPEVTVAMPIVKTLPSTLDFTGTTRGVEQVDVRAQVRGLINVKNVKGGEKVKAGDPLFTIDPTPFKTEVDQAVAEVSLNDAKLRLAQVTLDRKTQSAAGNAVSKFELDEAIADRDAAKAQVELSQAKLHTAQIQLGYTEIKAPISGRVSVKVPDIGQLVGPDTGMLCQIIDDSTIYVTFNVPESTVLTLRKQFLNQRPGEGTRPTIPIFVGFDNDNGTYPFEGRYERGDPGFDPNTGTTVVEGIFDNANGRMVPGAFARIKSVTGSETVTLVPDAAVSNDQAGRYVLVVDKDNKVQRVSVEVGGVIDRMRKVTSGLAPDAHIVVNGLQRARPGIVVKPIETKLPEPKLDLGVDTKSAATQAAMGATTTPSTQP